MVSSPVLSGGLKLFHCRWMKVVARTTCRLCVYHRAPCGIAAPSTVQNRSVVETKKKEFDLQWNKHSGKDLMTFFFLLWKDNSYFLLQKITIRSILLYSASFLEKEET